MDAFEMKTLNDGSRLVEKFADFAGSVILQLMQKQGYVEEQGIKALLNHIKKGGGTLTVTLTEERAEDFKELLKEAHIPFVEIEHVDATTKERSIFFVYRDCDQTGMKEVLKRFELALDKSCHEVDLETFEAITDKKNFGSVEGLTKEEVYAFREAAKDYNIHFCVVGNKDNYRILGTDVKVLEDIVSDMFYNLSGKLGHDYVGRLSNYFRQQEDFAERLRPEPGKVKYIRAVVEGREDGKDENKAIAYMLGIEHSERSVLRTSKELSPSLLNETQREALERREKRPVTEQTMNKEMAKLLRNQSIDRKMAMDVDR